MEANTKRGMYLTKSCPALAPSPRFVVRTAQNFHFFYDAPKLQT